jgi:hypothetical protein
MDGQLSRKAKKDAKILEKIKKAESNSEVVKHLDIVEDFLRILEMRVYSGKKKTKLERGDLVTVIIFISPVIVVGLIFEIYYGIHYIILICTFIALPVIFIMLDGEFERRAVTVDKTSGVMKITRFPFPHNQNLSLDHVLEFRIDRTYDGRHHHIVAVINDAISSGEQTIHLSFGKYYEQCLMDAIILRLNYVLNQYRNSGEIPL